MLLKIAKESGKFYSCNSILRLLGGFHNNAYAKNVAQESASMQKGGFVTKTFVLLVVHGSNHIFSIFMNMQIQDFVCHQSEKFADGVRREALPSSREETLMKKHREQLGETVLHRSIIW